MALDTRRGSKEVYLGPPGVGKFIIAVPECYRIERESLGVEEAIRLLKGTKVLHAPVEIAGNMDRICRHLRAKGINAVDVNYYDSWLHYSNTICPAINFMPKDEASRWVKNFAREAIEQYDIFHFHFGMTLLRDYSDLPELIKRGKKIVFSFWGSDTSAIEWIYYNQAKFLGYDPPKPYIFSRQQLKLLELLDTYADVMMGLLFPPRWFYSPQAIELKAWTIEEKMRLRAELGFSKNHQKVYFVHAPTSVKKKGSNIILKLFQEASRRLPVELVVVQGKKPYEAKRLFSIADFAIDQVGWGTFGAFGVEMMAWEIPVLVYHDPQIFALRGAPPIIHITRENFFERLQYCVELKQSGRLEELGKRCRQWVEQWGGIENWIDEFILIYAKICCNDPVPHFPGVEWRIARYAMQKGAKSPFYQFMFQYNIFEEIGVKPESYDKGIFL